MLIAPKETPNIIDSNLDTTESGVEVWVSDATYTLNDIVQIDGGTRKYKAIQNVPENINPQNDVNVTIGYGTYWYDYEATNYYKPFDELGSSVCENQDLIYYKFQVSDVDILMLDNIEAKDVRVVVTNNDTGDILNDITIEAFKRIECFDWFDWTYDPPVYIKTVKTMMTMAFNATLEIYINNPDYIAKVGHIAFGRSRIVGLSLANPAPVVSYRGVTSKTRDEWGNIVTRKKARYKRMTITCMINAKSIDIVESRLDGFADKPLIILGDESDGGFESLAIYGELKDHDMPIGVINTKYQLEVEGYQ